MTRIKICGITTPGDAQAAAEAGVDAIGLNFWPGSARYVNEAQARRVVRDLPPDVLRIGVFVDASAEEMEEMAALVGLDAVQLHGAPDRPVRLRWWQALSAGSPGWQILARQSLAEIILLDTPAGPERGGTGRTFDWTIAREAGRAIILAGGLGPDNVAAAVRQVRPWGVDACSRLEIEPGRKDHGKMKAFVKAVRETD
ncbi:MAG: phosphoribosylanthranilate isomerase [Bryobacteraceae bacterium]|nr:phosphoribosylanthranilate isomerase [Solibacteraceae bacterium]MCL4844228.1 phosphoribosylanthranilate isomerase [Bryobacteraceae bacterium]MCO5349751.1 phosphoribosylanthranilate isomerase [Bryobacteraceae bacterium]